MITVRLPLVLALWLILACTSASVAYFYGVFSGFYAEQAKSCGPMTNNNPDTFIHPMVGTIGVLLASMAALSRAGKVGVND